MEKIGGILVDRYDIRKRVEEIGSIISNDYNGKNLVVIGVLKGGTVFAADLIRRINIPMELDFIAVSSYGASSETSGRIKITKDIDVSVEGKSVLIVEDIIDSGMTLQFLHRHFLNKNAADVKCCAILDKPDRRLVKVDVDYQGIKIPDVFAVGYGLDYAGRYRNLPDICYLEI